MNRTWDTDDQWDPANPQNKVRTRALQKQLRERLLAWDPIGVATVPEVCDEYDCMLSPLLHLLHTGASAEQVCEWVMRERSEHFGAGPDPAADRALSDDLVTWWASAICE